MNKLSVSHPVDNDPHFIVHLPGSNMDVCFNIDSKPGHILNLVSDRGTGTELKAGKHLLSSFKQLFTICNISDSVLMLHVLHAIGSQVNM